MLSLTFLVDSAKKNGNKLHVFVTSCYLQSAESCNLKLVLSVMCRPRTRGILYAWRFIGQVKWLNQKKSSKNGHIQRLDWKFVKSSQCPKNKKIKTLKDLHFLKLAELLRITRMSDSLEGKWKHHHITMSQSCLSNILRHSVARIHYINVSLTDMFGNCWNAMNKEAMHSVVRNVSFKHICSKC